MIFSLNKKTRTVIIIMIALVLTGAVIAHFYYKNINAASDPRVLKARLLYKEYNEYITENNYTKVFEILDSIQDCLSNTPHYKISYEMGVVLNNKAAALLSLFLNYNRLAVENLIPDRYAVFSEDSLLQLAEAFTIGSINIYEDWMSVYGNRTNEKIKLLIEDDFSENDTSFKGKGIDNFIQKRVKEIVLAQKETPRRASVSYTNLGIIQRHEGDYKAAIKSYEKAIELWDRNLSAKNNLNILLGRPIEKRGFLEKLFPPDREK